MEFLKAGIAKRDNQRHHAAHVNGWQAWRASSSLYILLILQLTKSMGQQEPHSLLFLMRKNNRYSVGYFRGIPQCGRLNQQVKSILRKEPKEKARPQSESCSSALGVTDSVNECGLSDVSVDHITIRSCY